MEGYDDGGRYADSVKFPRSSESTVVEADGKVKFGFAVPDQITV